MSQCQVCSAKSQMFLCNKHVDELTEMLRGLVFGDKLPNGKRSPGWLDYLADAATGQVKLGNASDPHVKTDEVPLPVNTKASRLMSDAYECLSYWVRDICETRQIRWIPVRSVEPGFIGPLQPTWRRLPAGYTATSQDLALWLLAHVSSIASSEGAGEALSEVSRLVSRIEKIINRPVPPRFIGPCPTIIDGHRRECGIRLSAAREATEVYCPACGVRHSVQELNIRLVNQTAYLKYKLADILRILTEAGEDLPSRSSFYAWCKDARERRTLKVRGYERPNGRMGLNRHSTADQELFWVSDVRKIIRERLAERAC